MNKLNIIKISVAALFVLSIITCVFSVVTFGDIHISVLDMVNMSSDITELMDKFGTSSELISSEISSYFLFGILLFALPIVECIAVLLVRGKIAFAVSISGVLMNNVVAFIIYDKLSNMIALIDEAISFLSLDMTVEISKVAVIFWCFSMD